MNAGSDGAARSTVTVDFDGGCVPNPGQKYGSYRVVVDGRLETQVERVNFGSGTNNEAEFEACERGLLAALAHCDAAAPNYWLVLVTDSKIVKNRLTGKNVIYKKAAWRESSERMFRWANRCLELARRFRSFEVRWQPREHNVAVFGH